MLIYANFHYDIVFPLHDYENNNLGLVILWIGYAMGLQNGAPTVDNNNKHQYLLEECTAPEAVAVEVLTEIEEDQSLADSVGLGLHERHGRRFDSHGYLLGVVPPAGQVLSTTLSVSTVHQRLCKPLTFQLTSAD